MVAVKMQGCFPEDQGHVDTGDPPKSGPSKSGPSKSGPSKLLRAYTLVLVSV